MNDFIGRLGNILTRRREEALEEGVPSSKRKEDARPPNSPTSLQNEPPHTRPSPSLDSLTTTFTQVDAPRQNARAKRKASTAEQDEKRLLGDSRTPSDATLISIPHDTPAPPRSMPRNKYSSGGFQPRNTLNEPKKGYTSSSNRSQSTLSLEHRRGDNVQSHHHEFPDLAPSKRRKVERESASSPVMTSRPIELDRQTPNDPITTLERVPPSQTPKRTIIYPVSGVNESRSVDSMMNPNRACHISSSQRPVRYSSRGQSLEQPVEVVDDAPEVSTRQPFRPRPAVTSTVDDDELAYGNDRPSVGRKREGSRETGTRSHHFPKRTKNAAEKVLDDSEPEVIAVSHSVVNVASRNGPTSKVPKDTRTTFKRDAALPRRRLEDSADELANTPDRVRDAKKDIRRNPQSPSTSEPRDPTPVMPETPPQETESLISPADIPHTQFTDRTTTASAKRNKGPESRRRKNKQADIFHLETYRDVSIATGEEGSYLKYAEGKGEFLLAINDRISPFSTPIDTAKVKTVQWSPEDDCNLVRVLGPRTCSDGIVLIWDLGFQDHHTATAFISRMRELTSFKEYSKTPAELKKMFDVFPTQRPRTMIVDEVVDRNTELELLDRRSERRRALETPAATANGLTKSGRLSKARTTQLSDLLASVPSEHMSQRKPADISHPSRTARGKPVTAMKYDSDDQADNLEEIAFTRTQRAVRSTRKKALSPTPEPIERYSIKHGLGEPWDQPVVYPEDGKKRTTVEFHDLERLDEGEFLNDNLIEFYLRYLQVKYNTQEDTAYFFSTHFYTALSAPAKGHRGINYDAVKRWTAKEDIFKYPFVVVPVNESAHWYLAIICNLHNLHRKLETEDEVIEVEDFKQASKQGKKTPTNTPEISDDAALRKESEEMQEDYSHLSLHTPVTKEINKDEELVDLVEDKLEEERSKNGPEQDSRQIDNLQVEESEVNSQETATPSRAVKKGKRKSIPPRKKYDPIAPTIVILDSLGSTHSRTISNLKDYLIEEGRAKRGIEVSRDELKGMHAKQGIPMQDNWCDCGLFLCNYTEAFMKDPRTFGSRLLAQDFDEVRDWGDTNASSLRSMLRDLLQVIALTQSDERKRRKAEKRNSKRSTVGSLPALASADIQARIGKNAGNEEHRATRSTTPIEHSAATEKDHARAKRPPPDIERVQTRLSHEPAPNHQSSIVVVESTSQKAEVVETLSPKQTVPSGERTQEQEMLFDQQNASSTHDRSDAHQDGDYYDNFFPRVANTTHGDSGHESAKSPAEQGWRCKEDQQRTMSHDKPSSPQGLSQALFKPDGWNMDPVNGSRKSPLRPASVSEEQDDAVFMSNPDSEAHHP